MIPLGLHRYGVNTRCNLTMIRACIKFGSNFQTQTCRDSKLRRFINHREISLQRPRMRSQASNNLKFGFECPAGWNIDNDRICWCCNERGAIQTGIQNVQIKFTQCLLKERSQEHGLQPADRTDELAVASRFFVYFLPDTCFRASWNNPARSPTG